jgi:hypothetical protein
MFTLAPAEDQSLPESIAAASESDSSSSDLEPVARSSMSTAIAEAAAAAHQPAPEDESDEAPTSARRRPAASTMVAAVSFFLAGLAWAFAPFSSLTFLVMPFCVLAFLTGLIALGLACFSKPRKFVLPAIASTAATFLLLIILLTPSLLGPSFERARQRSPQIVGMQAIPLRNAPVLKQTPEWTDASKYTLQNGGISVHVVSVAVGPQPGVVESKPKVNPEKFLNVRVRVTLPQRKIGTDVKAFDWTDKNQPRLTNKAGTPIAMRQSHAFAPAGAKRRADLFPIQTTEEVFVFEVPPAGWESLRLEVPAAALGGTGVYRFTIPASMLDVAPPKENK